MQRWPGSPNKRGSPFVNTPEAKAKRLKAIQDALPSSSTPPTRPPTLPHVNTGATVAGLGNNPVTPSSSSTAQKSRRLEAIRQVYKLENLGINLDGPRPTVPNPMFQSMGIGRQLDTTESEDELWIHLSPPTSQDEVAADLLSDEPIASASMKVDKGKQRASDEEQRQEEEKKKEDAFWTVHSSQLLSHLTTDNFQPYLYVNHHQQSPATKRQNVLFTSTADPTASPAASTSTTVNNSSSNDLTGERIEQIVQANMEGLQGLQGIPAYVRKLERKLLASQNSNDYKAKKIQELEAELRECVLVLFLFFILCGGILSVFLG
ncbi:hypothetical protein AN958_03094 [Leucoagaricus sp. SymC.cos]|nr:hypothetical protein AN958_03094 [Leucoagaricus sp. SymC.cos]